ncbi:RNA ligase family protein [Catenulispora yoronensis]
MRAGDLSGLVGRRVVVTEKMDGENTTLYRDGLHARSLDSAHHPSRTWIKALHGRIAAHIPEGWRICGENLFARHSIPYSDLDSYFYGFSVWDGDRCLDWDSTVAFLQGIGIPTPRVLYRGVFDGDERKLGKLFRLDLNRQEGYVVRAEEAFAYSEFGARVAKWVRPSHVQTDTHWMFAEVTPNELGRRAPLWAVRSGVEVNAPELAAAIGLGAHSPARSRAKRCPLPTRTWMPRPASATLALSARSPLCSSPRGSSQSPPRRRHGEPRGPSRHASGPAHRRCHR